MSNLSRRTPLPAAVRAPRAAMGRASRSADLLSALPLLLLLLRTTTARALGPRISVPLGKCCGARQRDGSAASKMLGRMATTKEG